MLLLSSYSTETNPILGQFIFVFCILLFGGGGLWVLITLESRVEKYIRKAAKIKRLEVSSIRDTNHSDGKNPFGRVSFRIGGSSRIFGFSGERTYNKIVSCKKNNLRENYWVKVQTSFFIPSSNQWEKL